jgi:protein-L-isoaspartate(D-aspartate) O-methyltransferase
MDGERARTSAGAEPVADDLALEEKRSPCAAFVRRPISFRDERPVGDADRREVERDAEMKREPRPARMVAPGGVDQDDLRHLRQRTHGGLEKRPFPEPEEPGLVPPARRARDEGGADELAGAHERCRGPAGFPRPAGPGGTAPEAEEAAADRRVGGRRPKLGRHPAELRLARDQLLRRNGPALHGHHTDGMAGPTQADLVAILRAEGIADERVLAAFDAVPRAGFVPADLGGRAYLDEPLPIPHGQVTTQPSLVARMIEGLALTGSERVLEIGAGHGFQTAVLARLANFVWSIERWEDLARTARDNLRRHGVENVEVVVGDGSEGLAEQAPFEAIIVSAAFPRVPGPLADQVADGGRLVQPVGPGGREEVVLFERGRRGLERRRTLTGAHFVRLYGRHGFGA